MSNLEMSYSGIDSLRGFSYQILVFIHYLSQLAENETLYFEALDDIGMSRNWALPDTFDSVSEKVISMLETASEKRAIQVKRTTVTSSIFKKVVLNWLLLYSQDPSISEYVLVTDTPLDNNLMDNVDVNKLYASVFTSQNSSLSIKTKVKNAYHDKDSFCEAFSAISAAYRFEIIDDMSSKIEEGFAIPLHRAAIGRTFYLQRVEELCRCIMKNILDCISQRSPFYCTHAQLYSILENICQRISDEKYEPSYSAFRSGNTVVPNQHSREYRQLKACEHIDESFIQRHLMYQLYYINYRQRQFENNRKDTIDDIDGKTYDNFQDAKMDLLNAGCDTPYNRLRDTKAKTNHHTFSDEIKYGSCIYLTSDQALDEMQISWEDEL